MKQFMNTPHMETANWRINA